MCPIRPHMHSIANSATKIYWIQNLLLELGLLASTSRTLFYDNAGDTYLCANLVYHSSMKHVALDYHFVTAHYMYIT